MARLPRLFVPSTPSPAVQLPGLPVTVVTYNLLAQKYVDAGAHNYCPAQYRTWQSRWPRIAAELETYSADILCLQEVEVPVFQEQLVPMLKLQDMQGLHRPRGGLGSPPEGVAFFHRASKFDCMASHIFGFGDNAPGGEGFCKYVRARQEGAILTLLRHRETGTLILAGSVHLYFHPEWPDIKLAQAALLCSEVAKLITSQGLAPADVPVILGGDWNSLWRKYRPDKFDPQIPKNAFVNSGVYNLFEHNMVDSSHHEHPASRHAFQEMSQQKFTTAGLQLHSAYAAGSAQQEPPLTTQTAWFKGCLDYVWLSSRHWHVTHVLDMPYQVVDGFEPHADSFAPIPDADFPSDHLAMGCKIVLKQ